MKKTRWNLRKGFTLLEVLVVVVISIVILTFSVPVYKRTQEKNRYMAAQGVLLDLANGVRMLRTNYPDYDYASDVSVENNASNTTDSEPPKSIDIVGWMMANKYINQIQFANKKYMGYSFKIRLDGNTVSCDNCSGIACMSDNTNAIFEYRCASVDYAGDVHHNN